MLSECFSMRTANAAQMCFTRRANSIPKCPRRNQCLDRVRVNRGRYGALEVQVRLKCNSSADQRGSSAVQVEYECGSGVSLFKINVHVQNGAGLDQVGISTIAQVRFNGGSRADVDHASGASVALLVQARLTRGALHV
eukprot:7491959-Pyramimonas_sp.AAC.1